MKTVFCPICFMKEIDVALLFDEETATYYCRKCCFDGPAAEAERIVREYRASKYKLDVGSTPRPERRVNSGTPS